MAAVPAAGALVTSLPAVPRATSGWWPWRRRDAVAALVAVALAEAPGRARAEWAGTVRGTAAEPQVEPLDARRALRVRKGAAPGMWRRGWRRACWRERAAARVAKKARGAGLCGAVHRLC